MIKQNKKLTDRDWQMLAGTLTYEEMLDRSLVLTWNEGEQEMAYAIVDWVEDNAQDFFYTTTIGVNAKKFYFKSPLDFDNMQKLHQNMPVTNLKLIK